VSTTTFNIKKLQKYHDDNKTIIIPPPCIFKYGVNWEKAIELQKHNPEFNPSEEELNFIKNHLEENKQFFEQIRKKLNKSDYEYWQQFGIVFEICPICKFPYNLHCILYKIFDCYVILKESEKTGDLSGIEGYVCPDQLISFILIDNYVSIRIGNDLCHLQQIGEDPVIKQPKKLFPDELFSDNDYQLIYNIDNKKEKMLLNRIKMEDFI